MKFDDMMKALGEDRADLPALTRKALTGKNNFLAGKAAKVAAERKWTDLVPEMVKAYDRFFAEKSDPQCWAKNAISKALSDLEYFDDPQLFVRGLRHVQMEPVWAGQQDTATTLRSQCAHALVDCRRLTDIEVLQHLTDVLVDPEKTVRSEAARAVGRVGRPEAALLLRLRALSRDSEPEVIGTVFSALLEVDRKEGIPFVSRFLDRDAEVAEEAAIALGLTHDEAALQALKARLELELDGGVRAALLRGIALTRLPEAVDDLIAMVRSGSRDGRAAIDALGYAALNDDARQRLADAVRRSDDDQVKRAFETLNSRE